MIFIHIWFATIIFLTALLDVVDGLNLWNRRSMVLSSTSAVLPTILAPTTANAIPLFEKRERRQLELCLVNVLRVQYWATNIAETLQNAATEEEKKKAYLEARLGAKAMVADKSIKIWKQDEEASELSDPIDMVAWRKKCIKESKQRY